MIYFMTGKNDFAYNAKENAEMWRKAHRLVGRPLY